MKYLFFLFFILKASMSCCQTAVSIIACYAADDDIFIYTSLSLNSDSTCFIHSNCECGDETFTKAKWEIKGNNLKLVCLPDSTYSIYPRVEYVYDNTPTDSVAVYFTDYFQQPVEATLLAFRQGDTTFFNPERIRFDQYGKVVLSKQAYYGFMMAYEEYCDHKKGEAIGYYFENEHKLAGIKFYSGFGQAAYDRTLKQKNLGTLQYIMKEDGLYTDAGELIFKKCEK